MPEDLDGWISLADVGRAYGLSPAVTYRLAQLGHFGEVRKLASRLVVRAAAAEGWRLEHQAAPTQR